MFGLSEDMQTKVGYALVAVGVAGIGYAVWKSSSSKSSGKKALAGCGRKKSKGKHAGKKKTNRKK